MSAFTQSNFPTQQSSAGASSGSATQQEAHGATVPSTYTIGGVRVEFPAKAYPSQLAMMNKVIQGLKHRQNCLLESPTGSGKSLALLCAALAWQRQEAARVEQYNAEISARQYTAAMDLARRETQKLENTATTTAVAEKSSNIDGGQEQSLWKAPDPALVNVPSNESSLLTSDESMEVENGKNLLTDDDDDDDDFQPLKKTARKATEILDKENIQVPKPARSAVKREKVEEHEVITLDDDNYVSKPSEHKLSVPKIFFGTRTHKQISQITRELRKTHYKTSRSVVLASREHTCVNPVVEKLPNKNEACRELLEDTMGGCQFHIQAKKFGNFYTLSEYVEPGYDLEDFVKAGRRARACPYFAARNLMLQADIIFCPYNYLIDPAIRKSMAIELENQIVIFDEAHNMEDAAREASSFVVSQDELQTAMQDFEKLANTKGSYQPYAHQQLAHLMSVMSGWMGSQEKNLKTLDFENSGKYWTGTELIAELEFAGINGDLIKMNQEYLQEILRHREEEYEKQKERGPQRFSEEKTPEVQGMTIKVAESVILIFESLNAADGKQRDDFRIALLKNTVRRRRDNYGSGYASKEVLSLNIWCLNPAVAFNYLKEAVHAIVLTSGTLSPMQSFQSELGVPFPIKLEASHVIDRNQVFASVLGVGPSNLKLNGSYRNVDTFQYQDELGNLVLRISHEMPYGVLVFFPSYRLLEKVSERWNATGLWRELNRIKMVQVEPRGGSYEFDHAITCFYEANASPIPPQNGGMFLAVCRGKVSEGIDFANNNARAVICVGIPFPAFKDLQVELKRDYNQQNRARGLLSGGEWYEIQAFRALNQALGRCIRHRNDWGAIILVDERFLQTPRYTQSLSKWVRNSVEGYTNWDPFIKKFNEFKENMLARPLPETSIETYTILESSAESPSLTEDRSMNSSSSLFSDNSIGRSTPVKELTEPNWFAQTAFNIGTPRNAQKDSKGVNGKAAAAAASGRTIPQMFLQQQRVSKRQRDNNSNW